MSIVKILNTSDKDYSEKFQDEIINIPAKGIISMPRSKGVIFFGTLPPAVKNEFGNYTTPEKPLKLFHEDEQVIQEEIKEKFISNYSGVVFNTKEELDKHHKLLNINPTSKNKEAVVN